MHNTLIKDTQSIYYNRFKGWMLDFISEGPNTVLDLGCASGLLGTAMIAGGKALHVDGVEIFDSAAQQASRNYRTVHTGDIELINLKYTAEFDYIVCGDILEHLKDPYTVVDKLFQWLKPGGHILLSLPNVRNFRVIGEVIFKGDWKYVPQGIMDNTHLRFFTLRSAARMLVDAGFEIYVRQARVEGPRKTLLNRLTFGSLSEFLASQIFIAARRPINIMND